MDIQRSLLSCLIHDGSIAYVVSAKITPSFFTDAKYRRIYEFVLEHWRTYGTPADLAVVNAAFPSYTWERDAQGLDFFINGLRQRRKRAIVLEMVGNVMEQVNAKDEPNSMDNAVSIVQEALVQVALETTPTLDIDFTQQAAMIEQLLDERESNPGYLRGISTGFQGIDYVTGGLQPEQFVVMIGLPKSMKSSTMLAMAKAVHEQGRLPLFIGFEMSNIEQQDRLVSLYSGISLTKVMNGTLSLRERETVAKAMRRVESSRAFITSADLTTGTTVSGIQAKIMEYRPDVVFIDAAYLMRSELPKTEPGSAQALTDIARSLKQLAQSQGIPIIASTQATLTRSKGGLNMFSAMYTQAWGQSADVLLGVERVDPDASDTGPVTIRFKVLASRAGPRAESILMWDWNGGAVTELPRTTP
jgi:replicative DNA helicase